MGLKWVICTVYKLYLNRVALYVKLNGFSQESLPRAHATLPFRTIPVPQEAVAYTALEASRLVQYKMSAHIHPRAAVGKDTEPPMHPPAGHTQPLLSPQI